MNEPLGSLIGKDAVRSYWAKASELIPDLHFELVTTLVGVNSITLYYQGPLGMSTQCLQFGTELEALGGHSQRPLVIERDAIHSY